MNTKRQRLGQHYLVDPDVVRRIVSTAKIGPGEKVLEIGTGRGTLTRELKAVSGALEGYEVDPLNFKETVTRAGGRNVSLHLADAFRAKPIFDVLVSSLPYSRSADFVEWLSQMKYDRAVVLLQEDFVQKIASPPGSRNYRAVSAIAQIASAIRLGEAVGREAFSPMPRVDSRITTFLPKRRLRMSEVDLIKRLFTLRRRTLSAALALTGIVPTVMPRNPGERVYRLSPTEVYEIVADAKSRA